MFGTILITTSESELLCLKVVGDSGCKEVKVFSGDTLDHIKNLQGHRGSVTGLVFRKGTHTLYSASEDRSVKVWNLDDMAYVESL